MLRLRFRVPAVISAALMIVACASVGPIATPGASSPTLASPTAIDAPSGLVVSSAPPTIAVPSSAPTGTIATASTSPTVAPSPLVSPSATPTPSPKSSPKASHSPKPTGTPAPSAPNLIVSKLTSDTQLLGIDVPTAFHVAIKNAGSADAGPFRAVVTYAEKGSNDQTPLANEQSVDVLAGGQSVQLTFTGTVSHGGDYVFTATADSADEVTESKEDDNTRTLELSTIGQPNLAFDPEGVLLATCIGGPDANERFGFGVDNIGKADVTKDFEVSITWYQGGTSSGTLDPDPIAEPLPVGEGREEEFCRMLPGSGMYKVVFVIDSDHVIDESNEDDNQISVDVNIP